MNRSKLGSLAAVVLTSALVLGTTAAPATAAKPAGKGSAKASAAKGKSAGVRAAKPAKAAQPFAAQKRVVAKRIATTDAALQRQARRVSASGVVQAPVVLANITADGEALAEYATDLAAATTLTEVRAVAVLVGSVRPEIYSLVVDGLRLAADTHATVAADVEIQELAGVADAKELEGHDVSAVRALLAEASSATAQVPPLATAVVDAAVVITARSAAAERDAFAAQVDALGTLRDEIEAGLVEAEALLAAMSTTVDPVPDPGTGAIA